jgi:hypothetical protein
VSGYVDLFITEPREEDDFIYSGTLPRPLSQQGDNDESLHSDVELVAHDLQLEEATEKLPHNIIISLLSVSYMFRDITLKILSEAFGIERTTDGRCIISSNTEFYRQGLMCHLIVHRTLSGIY